MEVSKSEEKDGDMKLRSSRGKDDNDFVKAYVKEVLTLGMIYFKHCDAINSWFPNLLCYSRTSCHSSSYNLPSVHAISLIFFPCICKS